MKIRIQLHWFMVLGLAVASSALADTNDDFVLAAVRCNRETLQKMLDQHHDVNAPSPRWSDSTALVMANRCGLDVIQLLIDRGANVRAANQFGHTILHRMGFYCEEANQQQLPEILALLASRGADFNSPDARGNQPAALAARCGFQYQKAFGAQVLTHLLKQGANPDSRIAPANGGSTALEASVKNRNLESVRALLASGATIDVADRFGRTPLMWASSDMTNALNDKWMGHDATYAAHFDLLLQFGANIHARDSKGNTPLSYAVWELVSLGGWQIPEGLDLFHKVKKLIQFGADRQHVDSEGNNLLAVAVKSASLPGVPDQQAKREQGAVNAVKFLLDQGVDPTHKNLQGQTAGDLARELGLRELQKLL